MMATAEKKYSGIYMYTIDSTIEKMVRISHVYIYVWCGTIALSVFESTHLNSFGERKAKITFIWKKRNWLNARRLLGGILNDHRRIPNNSTRWEIEDTLPIKLT